MSTRRALFLAATLGAIMAAAPGCGGDEEESQDRDTTGVPSLARKADFIVNVTSKRQLTPSEAAKETYPLEGIDTRLNAIFRVDAIIADNRPEIDRWKHPLDLADLALTVVDRSTGKPASVWGYHNGTVDGLGLLFVIPFSELRAANANLGVSNIRVSLGAFAADWVARGVYKIQIVQ
jgi:hypothetical protein